jgi:mRNA interferase RelE/StbE
MVNPEPNDSKQLVNYYPYRRADQGEYRFIYKVEGEIIYILLVGKRNDDEVYRKMRDILK